jgi:hypothetical protein
MVEDTTEKRIFWIWSFRPALGRSVFPFCSFLLSTLTLMGIDREDVVDGSQTDGRPRKLSSWWNSTKEFKTTTTRDRLRLQ